MEHVSETTSPVLGKVPMEYVNIWNAGTKFSVTPNPFRTFDSNTREPDRVVVVEYSPSFESKEVTSTQAPGETITFEPLTNPLTEPCSISEFPIPTLQPSSGASNDTIDFLFENAAKMLNLESRNSILVPSLESTSPAETSIQLFTFKVPDSEPTITIYTNYTNRAHAIVGIPKNSKIRETFFSCTGWCIYVPRMKLGKGWVFPLDKLDEMKSTLEKYGYKYKVTDEYAGKGRSRSLIIYPEWVPKNAQTKNVRPEYREMIIAAISAQSLGERRKGVSRHVITSYIKANYDVPLSSCANTINRTLLNMVSDGALNRVSTHRFKL